MTERIPKCKECQLFNKQKQECRVAVLVDGKEFHMPVDPNDHCHFIELGIPIEEVRWWEENNKVHCEYPENFFGKGMKNGL